MKNLRIKSLTMVAALALGVSLFTGCGGGGSPGGTPSGGDTTTSTGGGGAATTKYDLTFWVYSDFVQAEMGKIFNQWIDEFKAEHPEVNSITMVPKNDADLLSSLMSGVGLPDMFSASARDMKKYYDAIELLNIKSQFDGDDAFTKGFYPNALSAVTVDDGIYAIPFISYIPVIYRNLNVLEKAGINPADGIPTFDAFLQQLQKVKDAGVDPTHSWTNSGYFSPGAVMAADAPNITVGLQNSKTTVKPEQLVRTFETVKKIDAFGNQALSQGSDAVIQAFQTDKLGYMIDGPWIEPGVKASGVKYDIQLVPPYEVGGWTGGLQGWDFMYGVTSKDEARNQLVGAFMKKMGSYNEQKDWMLRIGRSTLRADVMNDPAVVSSSPIAQISSAGLQKGMMQMDFGHSTVFWPSAMTDSVAKLGRGEISPADCAQQFVDAINAMYAEAGE